MTFIITIYPGRPEIPEKVKVIEKILDFRNEKESKNMRAKFNQIQMAAASGELEKLTQYKSEFNTISQQFNTASSTKAKLWTVPTIDPKIIDGSTAFAVGACSLASGNIAGFPYLAAGASNILQSLDKFVVKRDLAFLINLKQEFDTVKRSKDEFVKVFGVKINQ